MNGVILRPSRVGSKIEIVLDIEQAAIKRARLKLLNVRNFSEIFKGRYVVDAPFVASRICGFCQTAHQVAAAQAVETAFGVEIPEAAVLIRFLLKAVSHLSYHLFHFYQQALPDWIDIKSILAHKGSTGELFQLKERIRLLIESGESAPFSADFPVDDETIADPETVAGLLSHYYMALEVQSWLAQMGALLGGRFPHNQSIVLGGITAVPGPDALYQFKALLDKVSSFVKKVYASDVIALVTGPLLESGLRGDGVSYRNFLAGAGYSTSRNKGTFVSGFISNGKLENIARFTPEKINMVEGEGGKKKNVVYENLPVETGALARLLVLREKNLLKVLDGKGIGPGASARHLARTLEAVLLANKMYYWLDKLFEELSVPGCRVYSEFKIRGKREAEAIIETPSGLAVHRLALDNSRIKEYLLVTGPHWLLSSGSNGRHSVIEKALNGITVDAEKPEKMLKLLRIIHSFDLCACSSVG